MKMKLRKMLRSWANSYVYEQRLRENKEKAFELQMRSGFGPYL